MADQIAWLTTQYGYWIVAGLVCIESFGIPVPGETALIAVSVYAATSGKIEIGFVIAAAAGGAIIGDNIGYLLGRKFGYRLLKKYGHYAGINDTRIKLGQYLFLTQGRKVVFFGRFLPVVREIAAFLAGANDMRWRPFLLANASGALAWTGFYGIGSFYAGKSAQALERPLEIGLSAGAAIFFVLVMAYLYRHEQQLEEDAKEALPGPVHPIHVKTQ